MSLWSDILGEKVPLRASTTALRWVDKAGGLDNYILYTPERKLQSKYAVQLKQRLVAVRAEKRRVAAAGAATSPSQAAAVDRAAILAADDAAFPGSLWEDQVQEGELPPLRVSKPTTHHVDLPPDVHAQQRAEAGVQDTWRNAWEEAEAAGAGEPDAEQAAHIKRADGWYRWVVPSGRVMLLTAEQYAVRAAAAAALKRKRIPVLGSPLRPAVPDVVQFGEER